MQDLVAYADPRRFSETTPAMNDSTLPLSSLSSVGGKSVVARFDGGMLSSNSGVLALAEVQKRLRVAERLARCIDDPRCPGQVVHSLADMIGFRMKMIAAGYEDGNDGRDLASQSTLCRLENLPGVRELVAMSRAMVDLYCASWAILKTGSRRSRLAPRSGRCRSGSYWTLTTPSTLCTEANRFACSMPTMTSTASSRFVVFDGAGRFVSAILRPAKRG